MLLLGMIELGRIVYTYSALEKIMYNLARYVGTQQGVDFCSESDATVAAAKNLAVTGNLEGNGDPIVAGLSADMLEVRVERYNPADHSVAPCSCSLTGCDAAAGGLAPDFVIADLPNGYSIRPLFFGLSVDPILLRPHVRVPYGGT
jgi:hypothetical protein